VNWFGARGLALPQRIGLPVLIMFVASNARTALKPHLMPNWYQDECK
jgi:hypothetical protein